MNKAKNPYIDGYLKTNLDAMKEDIRKDDDVVLVIDGRERIGKSVFAQQVGWYLSDGKLQLADICLTAEEFQKRVKDCPKYGVVIFDECYLGMASADAMKKYNRILMQLMVTVGQKNLCIILVLPSVFDLNKYLPLHRSDGLLHVFRHKRERGHFAFYNSAKLKHIYIGGKKFYSYGKLKPNFHGKFYNHYCIDETEYRQKKSESLNQLLSSQSIEEVSTRKAMLYRAIKIVKNLSELPNKDIAELLKCHRDTIASALKWQDSTPVKVEKEMGQSYNKTV